jgi:hypothetical protein
MTVVYQIKNLPGAEGHRRRLRAVSEGDGFREAVLAMMALEDMVALQREVFVCYANSEEERAYPECWRRLVDAGDGDVLVPVGALELQKWGLA